MGEAAHAEGGLLHGIEHPTGSAHVDMLKGDVKRNILMGWGGDDTEDPATAAAVEDRLFGNAGSAPVNPAAPPYRNTGSTSSSGRLVPEPSSI